MGCAAQLGSSGSYRLGHPGWSGGVSPAQFRLREIWWRLDRLSQLDPDRWCLEDYEQDRDAL